MRLWFKRVAPILLVLVVWLGYTRYGNWQAQRQERVNSRHALVTAQMLVATARYRSDPDRYMAYRDSALAANGLSTERMFQYLQRFQQRPEKYHAFTVAVNYYVDSLYLIEDSLRRGAANLPADSLLKE